MKQTAINWFYNKLVTNKNDAKEFNKLFKKAKLMEQRQIEKAFFDGGVDYMANIADDYPPSSKDYYNKKYKK
jgi:hypothetical protein